MSTQPCIRLNFRYFLSNRLSVRCEVDVIQGEFFLSEDMAIVREAGVAAIKQILRQINELHCNEEKHHE